MKLIRRLLLFFTILLLPAVFLVRATCIPADTGTAGNDTINCDVANQPAGNVTGQGGDDTINIGSGVSAAVNISGDVLGGGTPGSGNDTIINDGAVSGLFGDASSGAGSGSDVIVNNGTVNGLVTGDDFNSSGSGSDTIINNGTITGVLMGDTNNGNGSGSDNITNNGNVGGDILGDTALGLGTGNDVIVNNGNVTGNVYGDSQNGNSSGSDFIINNGVIGGDMAGESNTGVGSGNDMLVNNGTVNGHMVGDSANNAGSGSDIVINNGTVNGDLSGDSSTSSGSGNDTVINNGSAHDVLGDSHFNNGTGNDTIINTGTANNIYGDNGFGTGTGDDLIINSGVVNGNIIAAGGSDTVIIAGNSAAVNGTIDGGTGYDVLTFNITSTNPEELQSWADQIYAANPSGGTLILAGHIYTWTNFEELTQILFSLVRLNGVADPFAVFCSLQGGIDIYAIAGDEGILALNVSGQAISSGILHASEGTDTVQIGSSAQAVVYATSSGDIQVDAPNGFSFSFAYQNRCGALPEPQEVVVQPETEEIVGTIINRPR